MKLDYNFYIRVTSENIGIIVNLLYKFGYCWASDPKKILVDVNIHPSAEFLIITDYIYFVDSYSELNYIWNRRLLRKLTLEKLISEIESKL